MKFWLFSSQLSAVCGGYWGTNRGTAVEKTHWVGKVVRELSSSSPHAGCKEIAFVCRKSYVNFLRGASNNMMPLFVFWILSVQLWIFMHRFVLLALPWYLLCASHPPKGFTSVNSHTSVKHGFFLLNLCFAHEAVSCSDYRTGPKSHRKQEWSWDSCSGSLVSEPFLRPCAPPNPEYRTTMFLPFSWSPCWVSSGRDARDWRYPNRCNDCSLLFMTCMVRVVGLDIGGGGVLGGIFRKNYLHLESMQ